MAKIDLAFFDIGYLDTLAYRDSPVHRLDPRAKVMTTLVYIVAVASFDKYAVAPLLPFLLFPVALVALAGLPWGYLLKKLLLVAPFAFLIGAFNPFFDREILLHLGPVGIAGGWVSFASILLRFTLTILAALILIATTSFPGVCMALERLGAPKVFALQLLFLYRYLFVLVEEGVRVARARSLRSFHGRGLEMRVFGSLVGQLLLRTLARAQRIHLAMLCRGFTGDIRMLRPMKIGWTEVTFTGGWCAGFLLLRFSNLPRLLGGLLLELLS